MESFNIYNLSSSINNQLNYGFKGASEVKTKLQTGQKINSSKDDAGSMSLNLKINSELKQKNHRIQNLQNSLSLTQTQDGALKSAGEIIMRSSELKTLFESPTLNAKGREAYDEEFKELQMQLKNMRNQKFNGVSLFTEASDTNLTESSLDQSKLYAKGSGSDDGFEINRAGFLGSMKIQKNFPPQSDANAKGGNSGESRTTIQLLGPSGKLTWKQNPYSVTDHFKVIHGTEVLHEAVYGTGLSVELFDSPAQTGKRIIPVTEPRIKGERVDIIDFGKNGNAANTLELIVNEFGQTSTGTGWDAEYSIEYDPYEQELVDDSIVWSLNDFSIQDFNTFLDNLTDARAENGATQQRIKGEIEELKASIQGMESHLENSEGLDIANAVGELNTFHTRLSVNANLLKSAQEMENTLYTDFL